MMSEARVMRESDKHFPDMINGLRDRIAFLSLYKRTGLAAGVRAGKSQKGRQSHPCDSFRRVSPAPT